MKITIAIDFDFSLEEKYRPEALSWLISRLRYEAEYVLWLAYSDFKNYEVVIVAEGEMNDDDN